MALQNVFRWSLTTSAIAFTLCLVLTSIPTANSDNVDHCVSKSKCRDCIRTVNCSWCMQTDIGNITRCFPSDHKNDCQLIWSPQSTLNYVKHESLSRKAKDVSGYQIGQGNSYVKSTEESSSSFSNSSYSSHSSSSSYSSYSRKSIQVSPQRVQLQLRMGKRFWAWSYLRNNQIP